MKWVLILLLIRPVYSDCEQCQAFKIWMETFLVHKTIYPDTFDFSPYYTLDFDSNIVELKLNNMFERLNTNIENIGNIYWFPELKGLDISNNPDMASPVRPLTITADVPNLKTFSAKNTPNCNFTDPKFNRDDYIEFRAMGFKDSLDFCKDYIPLDTSDLTAIERKPASNPLYIGVYGFLNVYKVNGAVYDIRK